MMTKQDMLVELLARALYDDEDLARETVWAQLQPEIREHYRGRVRDAQRLEDMYR